VDFISKVDSARPYAWIVDAQTQVDGTVFDPYLAFLTGYKQQRFPAQLYLFMGQFNPQSSLNTALGLAKGGVVPRPQVVPKFEIPNLDQISFELDFPTQAYSGEFFAGQIQIDNLGSKLLDINQIKVGSADYTQGATRIIPDIFQLVIPGRNIVSIDFLREPDFFADRAVDHNVRIELGNGFRTFNDNVQIKYTPDVKIFIALLSLVIIVTASFAYLTIKLSFRYARASLKARQQVYGKPKQAVVAKPQTSTKNPNVIKVEDILN
jgi:hypothetical protein